MFLRIISINTIDYFTKWIEAKPVATITGAQIKKFVWDNIVCRFGLPREIISDNGKQFRDNPFKDWCEKLCGEGDGVSNWTSSGVIGERVRVMSIDAFSLDKEWRETLGKEEMLVGFKIKKASSGEVSKSTASKLPLDVCSPSFEGTKESSYGYVISEDDYCDDGEDENVFIIGERSVLTDPEDQAKMEMETPRSSGVNSPPNAHT
ncbi:reverse transcriptase domain-containing protein [Tanacetum coccineum]